MKLKILIFAVFFFTASLADVSAYWIWTPKSKRWTNPKTAVKPSPEEQLDSAKAAYEAKRYDEAIREFKKLLRSFPKSKEAAVSQYHLGLIEEAQGDLYEAYLAYQKTIDKYPFFEKIPQIIEREYKIAEAFMGGAKRRAMGLALPVENPAIEIFTKVINNSSYGPLAASAQYKLGLVLKGLARYYEAEEAFHKVITSYPDSEWVEASKFQIASCRAAVSRSPDYDQVAFNEAKEQFEQFVREHPDAVLSGEAEENINKLNEKEAESNYNTAFFYEKQKAYEAAKIYYREVVENSPQSIWAAKALERLQVLEKRKK
ncbi:MAG: tetratricopeptide repeat protein [Candidatus Omnitrophica bacterium]|nr:tetratricopeptide repeat protein [Candidatus Omnitrophota bacterium]